MRFDREPWVKLYRHEGPQHRLMSLEARSFRDFLLRHANDDGVLIPRTKNVARDLCKVVAADSKDTRKVRRWVNELVEVGYLIVSDSGEVRIRKFVEGQAARSKNAERQARWRARQKEKEESEQAERDESEGDSVTSHVTPPGNAHGTLQREEMRRDGDGDETRSPRPPEGLGNVEEISIPCPSPALPPMVIEELAGYYELPIATIQAAEKRFKNHFIAGKGAGRRHSRAMWLSKCREWIRRDFESGKLTAEQSTQPSAVMSP